MEHWLVLLVKIWEILTDCCWVRQWDYLMVILLDVE